MRLLTRHFTGRLIKGKNPNCFGYHFDFGISNEDKNESLLDFLDNLAEKYTGKIAQINILVTIEDE